MVIGDDHVVPGRAIIGPISPQKQFNIKKIPEFKAKITAFTQKMVET